MATRPDRTRAVADARSCPLAAALRGAGDPTQAEAIDRLADEAFSHATIWHRR